MFSFGFFCLFWHSKQTKNIFALQTASYDVQLCKGLEWTSNPSIYLKRTISASIDIAVYDYIVYSCYSF